MDTKNLIECFLNYVKEAKSKNTYRTYKADCLHLLDYLTAADMSVYFLMEQNEIDKYVEYLRKSGYSETTIKHNICIIRSLIKFCIEKKILPDKDINLKSKTEKVSVEFANYKDVSKLYNYCIRYDKSEEYFESRSKVCILFVILFGLKVSDLCELKIKDFSLSENTIATQGSLRYIYNKELIPYLEDFIKKRSEALSTLTVDDKDKDYLFLTRFGKKCSNKALNYDFQKICQELAIKDLSLSSLRNTCILDYYRELPDEILISKIFRITERRIIKLSENI